MSSEVGNRNNFVIKRDLFDDKINSSTNGDIIFRLFRESLPFLYLYNPLAKRLTILSESIRGIFWFGNLFISISKNDGRKIKKSLFRTVLAISSFVGTFFRHPIGLAISSFYSIFLNIKKIQKARAKGNNYQVLRNLFFFINSFVYFALFLKGSAALIVLSFLLQILIESYQGYHKLARQNPKKIEGYAKILLALVKGWQAAPLVSQYYRENDMNVVKIRDKIAVFFHRCASLLAIPFFWYSEKLIRSFTPFYPGEMGQWNTKRLEVISRIFTFSIAPLMIPLSLGLATIELFPRTLANMIAVHSFTYLIGEAEEKILPLSRQITVVTMNVCFVAGGFTMPYAGVVVPWRGRVDAVVEEISKKNPDIVCLQEVNDLEADYALFDRLKGEYSHFYVNIGPKMFAQNSGLFIASKYKIGSPSFTPFNTGTGSQKMVNKGFFDFDVISQGQSILHIFTTHLSPSKIDLEPEELEKERRKVEIRMLLEKMRQIKEELAKVPKLVFGDFNIPWESSEYNALIEEGFNDPYNADRKEVPMEEATCFTDFMTKRIFASKEKRDKLEREDYAQIMDFALIHKSGAGAEFKMETELIPAFNKEDPSKSLSDHSGLFSTIVID